MVRKAVAVRYGINPHGKSKSERGIIGLWLKDNHGWITYELINDVIRDLKHGAKVTVDGQLPAHLVVVPGFPEYVRSVVSGAHADNLLRLPER